MRHTCRSSYAVPQNYVEIDPVAQRHRAIVLDQMQRRLLRRYVMVVAGRQGSEVQAAKPFPARAPRDRICRAEKAN